jgi:hypothetical protein
MMNDRTPCQVVSFIQHLASPIQSNPIKTPFLHVRAVVGQAVHRQQQQSTRTQAAERERERDSTLPRRIGWPAIIAWLQSQAILLRRATSVTNPAFPSLACVARGRSEHGSNRKRGKRGAAGRALCAFVYGGT